jgi:hypothetical protein
MVYNKKIKIFLLAIIGASSLAMIASDPPVGLLFFAIIGVPICISLYNDRQKSKIVVFKNVVNEVVKQNTISLKRKILNVVSMTNRPLSIYDFMIYIQESEEKIKFELDEFVNKGLAVKTVDKRGLSYYSFQLSPVNLKENIIKSLNSTNIENTDIPIQIEEEIKYYENAKKEMNNNSNDIIIVPQYFGRWKNYKSIIDIKYNIIRLIDFNENIIIKGIKSNINEYYIFTGTNSENSIDYKVEMHLNNSELFILINKNNIEYLRGIFNRT